MNINQIGHPNNLEIIEPSAKRQKVEIVERASFTDLPNELLVKLFRYLVDDFNSVMRLTLINKTLVLISDDLLHPGKYYDDKKEKDKRRFQFIRDLICAALQKHQTYPIEFEPNSENLPNPTKLERILACFFGVEEVLDMRADMLLDRFEKEIEHLEKIYKQTCLCTKNIKDLKDGIAIIENYSLSVVNHVYRQIFCKMLPTDDPLRNIPPSNSFNMRIATDISLEWYYAIMTAMLESKDSFKMKRSHDINNQFYRKTLQVLSKNSYKSLHITCPFSCKMNKFGSVLEEETQKLVTSQVENPGQNH